MFQDLTDYDHKLIIRYSDEDMVFYGGDLYPKRYKIMFTKIIKSNTTGGSHIQTSLN